MQANDDLSGDAALRPRILQVFPYYLREDTGGASGVRSVIETTIRLTGDSWDHLVLVPGPSVHNTAFERAGARLVDLGRRDHLILRRGPLGAALPRHLAQLVRDVPRIARLLRRERVVLVHSHSSAYLGAAIAARLVRVPVIVHVHERLDRLPQRLARWYRRIVALSASRIVLIARFMVEEWRGAGARATYIPNTSLSEAATERTPGAPVVGFLGRIAPRKGIEHLLRAMPAVLSRCPDARLVVVGGPAEPEDYPYLDALKQETLALGISAAVSFAGPVEDVAEALTSFRVLGFASPIDIAPITVLQAMAAGLPVVSASQGGAEDMILEGDNGFNVQSCDDAAIADRLAELLTDDALWERMAAASRRRFEQSFGPEQYAKKLTDLYSELGRRSRHG
jgi:glycosyltransferase involved in cell wall biosynthesis